MGLVLGLVGVGGCGSPRAGGVWGVGKSESDGVMGSRGEGLQVVEDVGCGGGLRDKIIWRWWGSTQGGGLGGWDLGVLLGEHLWYLDVSK